MEWKDLAPWITIGITVALSILVPLFTQIANNKHQRKIQRENRKYEKEQKKLQVLENFLSKVGGMIIADGHIDKEKLVQAGETLHQVYIYVPQEWYVDLDRLAGFIMAFEWKKAESCIQKLSRLISEELNK